MNAEELLRICSESEVSRSPAPILYWTSEYYSFGKYIRDYGFFPRWLPLATYSDHSGPQLTDEPYKHELENDAPSFLTHSVRKCGQVARRTGKRCRVMLSPAVHCRNRLGIEQAPDARGTIAFPVHALPSQTEEFDIGRYIEQLKRLPEEFQPVTVCLHMHDINKGRHEEYLRAGIPLVCSGHPSDDRFVERLYDHVHRHRYTTSNDVGTIAFFSIEMGIPFFVYGEEQISTNVSDENVAAGAVDDGYRSFPLYRYLRSRLEYQDGALPRIDGEVKDVVEEALGKKHAISRLHMAWFLWTSLFSWAFRARTVRAMVRGLASKSGASK